MLRTYTIYMTNGKKAKMTLSTDSKSKAIDEFEYVAYYLPEGYHIRIRAYGKYYKDITEVPGLQ